MTTTASIANAQGSITRQLLCASGVVIPASVILSWLLLPREGSQPRGATDDVYNCREKLLLMGTVKVQVSASDSQAYWGISWSSLGRQASPVSKGEGSLCKALACRQPSWAEWRKGRKGPRIGEA